MHSKDFALQEDMLAANSAGNNNVQWEQVKGRTLVIDRKNDSRLSEERAAVVSRSRQGSRLRKSRAGDETNRATH